MSELISGCLVEPENIRIYYYEVGELMEVLSYIGVKLASAEGVKIRIHVLVDDLKELRREIGALMST